MKFHQQPRRWVRFFTYSLKLITYSFLLVCHVIPAKAVNNLSSQLIGLAKTRYEQLEAFNDANERAGKKYLNNYIIELDVDNWIEDRTDIKILDPNYNDLARMLRDFNNSRKDNLRFYVVVNGLFQAYVKQDININQLPGSFDNFDLAFHDLLEPNVRNTLYDLIYGTKAQDITKGIKKGLKEKGYTERVVYYFAQMVFYDAKGESRWYSHDNLSLTGALVEFSKPILSKCRKDWTPPNAALMGGDLPHIRIKKAIANIINAIGVEYDGGGASTTGIVKCGKDFSDIVNETWDGKGALYNEAVKATAKLLDAPVSTQQFKSRYLIVDKPQNFADPIIREAVLPDVVFNAEMLPDKLNVLSGGKSDYKLYVVFKEVSFALPDNERAEFARAVKAQSTVAQAPNTIIIVVPYFSCVNAAINISITTGNAHGQLTVYPMLLMPCAYSPDGNMNTLMNSALVREKSFRGGFNQAFKYIPKDYKLFVWAVLWNGDARFKGPEEYKRVTGYEDLVSIRILQDVKLDQVQKGLDNLHCNPAMSIECQFNYDQMLEGILATPSDFDLLEGNSNLVQSLLTEDVARQFVESYISTKTVTDLPGITKDDLFYGRKNPFNGENVLFNLIDAASLVGSIFGVDWIFDGLGFYYAVSIGEDGRAAMYEISLLIPFATGAEMRGLVEGKNLLVRGAKGGYRALSRKAYGLMVYQRKAGEFSHLIRSVLQPESFAKAKLYSKELDFLEAVEDGVIADTKAAEALNNSPDLVDEFNAFHKAGKGNLDAFLKSKSIVLGLEEEIVKAASLIKKESDWVDVIVHGDANSFTVWHKGVKVKLDHRRLLNYMKSKGYTEGTNIRLLSCETGRSSLAIAQFLADKSKGIVKAPNVNIAVTEAGDVVSLGGIQGEWMYFKPNKSTPYSAASPEKIQTIVSGEKAFKLGAYEEVVVDLLAISKALDDPAFTVLSKYKTDDKFLSAFEDVLKNNGDKALKEINDYPDLIDDLYKQFTKSGKNVSAFVDQVAEARKSIDVLEKNTAFLNIRKQYLSKETPRVHADKLTLEEEASIRFYTISGVQDVNPALRGEQTATAFHKEVEKTINSGLDKLSAYNGFAYRGIAGSGELQFAKSLTEGKIINFKDFKSSSTNRAVGISYTNADGGYIYVIQSKTGRSIKEISPLQSESEILFKSRSEFKVTKIQDAANPPYVKEIHLQEISSAVDDAIIAGLDDLIKNLDAPVAQAVREFATSNPDPYMREMIEDAITKNKLDELKALVGLKSVPENQLMGASGKSYIDDIVIDPAKKAEDDANKLKYLNETERVAWEIKVKNGRLMLNNQVFEEGPLEQYMFVLASDGKIYGALQHGGGVSFRHSSFLAGGNVSTAGLIHIDEGIIYINNLSGHYLPLPDTLSRMIRELTARGVEGKSIRVRLYTGPGSGY